MVRAVSTYLIVFLLSCCATAHALVGNPEYVSMKWHGSLSDAVRAAQAEKKPVMVTLARNTPEEKKLVDKLASWPQTVQLSLKSMAAVQMKADAADAAELLQRMGLRAPAIVFMDHHGNPMAGLPWPEQATSITQVINSWGAMLASVEKFLKENQARGERYLAKGKLKEAYLEFSFAAPFKGPDAEKARDARGKVEEHWNRLLSQATSLPADSIGRRAIIMGLQRETFGTDFYSDMETEILKVAGTTSKAAPPKSATSASGIPKSAEKPKSLAELARSSSSSASTARSSGDDSAVDSQFMTRKNDPKLTEAQKLLDEGIAEYRKAVSDAMERGPERNTLLKSAHGKFEKSMTLIEQYNATKPDAQLEKLLERTSMLMYGALKYQSL